MKAKTKTREKVCAQNIDSSTLSPDCRKKLHLRSNWFVLRSNQRKAREKLGDLRWAQESLVADGKRGKSRVTGGKRGNTWVTGGKRGKARVMANTGKARSSLFKPWLAKCKLVCSRTFTFFCQVQTLPLYFSKCKIKSSKHMIAL